MREWWRWPVVSATSLLGACTALVDVSDLTGKVREAQGPNEAGVPLDAYAAAETSDDSPGESGSTRDASGNADAARPGAASRFCDEQGPLHTFCSDFDGPDASATAAWDASWTTLGATLGGVTVNQAAFASPASSLLITLLPKDSGASAHAFLSKTFGPPAPSKIDCAFDFRLDQGSPGSTIGFFDMWFDTYAFESTLSMLDSANAAFRCMNAACGAVALAQWVHIEVTFVRKPAQEFTLKLDGTVVNAQTPTAPADASSGRMSIGADTESGTWSGWRFRFDNVTCDIE